MPKNFLNFVYLTYIDNLKQVYSDDNSINSSILSDYEEKQFGLYIKFDKLKTKDQQLIFFCPKDQKVVEQFFLLKTLKDPEYFPENIEISLEESCSVISDSGIIGDNDKTNNKSQKNKSDKNSITSQENLENNKANLLVEIYLRMKP